MPMLPIRTLGQLGIIKDPNPYDLPPNALSGGNNVRFEDGKITRSPAFREYLSLSMDSPRHVFTISHPGNLDRIGIAFDNGSILSVSNGVESNVTPASGTVASSIIPYTSATFAGISYLNREDREPLYLTPVGSQYAELPNWDSGWRCKSLRGFKSYLIALNVSKSGTNYPSMVKWSDVTQFGAVPASWDETDPSTNAGENTLAEATTAIVDGFPLRNSFVIYTTYQAFLMTESGSLSVFNFRKLFDNRGLINKNCAVEVQGLHYCFGFNDIYVHDGSTYRSIVEGRVKDYIYGSLNFKNTTVCHVAHDPYRNEVLFCYLSADSDVAFPEATEANKIAAYNYVSDSWSFRDLPNCIGFCQSNVDQALTYDDISTTYDLTGGSYYELETSESKHMFTVAQKATTATEGPTSYTWLYGYDPVEGGLLPYQLSAEANTASYVSRVGIDLDEAGNELRAYKVIKSIYPQLDSYGDGSVTFRFRGTEYNDPVATFDTASDITWTSGTYKIDTREGGRYLAYKLSVAANTDFKFSGFDADVVSTGRR